ncbi:MAG: FixH family protein [Polyangiaceae bacterium]
MVERKRRTPGAAFVGLASSLVMAAACSSSTNSSSRDTADKADGAAAAPVGDGGAGAGDDAAADAPADAASCVTLGLHVDTFAPGLKQTGTGGMFTFVLASADPSPPADPLMNTWTIQVLDQSGAPVKDATVTLPAGAQGWIHPQNPWMPTMHHGSSIVNTITNNGDGTATIKMYFTMSGLWQTYVTAQSGQMTDSAMYSFCLP